MFVSCLVSNMNWTSEVLYLTFSSFPLADDKADNRLIVEKIAWINITK